MSAKLTSEDLETERLVKEIGVAGITLLLVDFLATFPKEVMLVWPTRISLCKALFFAVRYGTLVLAVLVYLRELTQTFTGKACKTIFTTTGILGVTLTLLGEAIVYIRVWAFSGCGRWVRYYLIGQYIALGASVFCIVTRFDISVKVLSGASSIGFSCVLLWGQSTIAIAYGVLLASVISCMMIIGVYRYNGSPQAGRRSGLFVQFYRDGLVYFLMLGTLCIANIAAIVTGHGALMMEWQIYLHSIISTRMILHLRECSGRTEVVLGQSLHADLNIKDQDLVGTSLMEILKAVLPKFSIARNTDVIHTRTVTTGSASVRLSTRSGPLP